MGGHHPEIYHFKIFESPFANTSPKKQLPLRDSPLFPPATSGLKDQLIFADGLLGQYLPICPAAPGLPAQNLPSSNKKYANPELLELDLELKFKSHLAESPSLRHQYKGIQSANPSPAWLEHTGDGVGWDTARGTEGHLRLAQLD